VDLLNSRVSQSRTLARRRTKVYRSFPGAGNSSHGMPAIPARILGRKLAESTALLETCTPLRGWNLVLEVG
jgi:hypothetical protein